MSPTTLRNSLTDTANLRSWLADVTDAADREADLTGLSGPQRAELAAHLDAASATELFSSVEPVYVVDLLLAADSDRAGFLLDVIDADLAAEVLREVPPARRKVLLRAMTPQRATSVRGLLTWPEDSAASRMTPDVLTIGTDRTAAEAIDDLRRLPRRTRAGAHHDTTVHVVDDADRLAGVVDFSTLVLADPDQRIVDLTDDTGPTVGALDDVEAAARVLVEHRLASVPVTDADGRLLGALTADDVSGIIEDEATEDAELQGGSQPLEVPYLRASPVHLWRKRVIWLLVLFVAEAYTGTVLRAFEEELDAVVSLAFFIPLLIGTGGNSGTQITTTLVRAMATNEVRLRDVGTVLGKELTTGLMIAATMASAGILRAFSLGVGWPVMLTVSISLAAIVLWSTLVASTLPLLLKRTRVDPAVVSAPLIATVVDGTGLLIYFTIAKLMLPELAGL